MKRKGETKGVYLRNKTYWIQFSRDGKPYRESSHSELKSVAKALLKRRESEMHTGDFVEPDTRKITVADLYEALIADYERNDRDTTPWVISRWNSRLKPVFGHLRAAQVTTAQLNKYIDDQREAGWENATINRDMMALRTAFSLGHNSTPRKVHEIPVFPPRLKENVRSGFLEETEYSVLCSHAHELWLRGLLAVAYRFGFRKEELLDLRVWQVNLLDRTIRLNRGETKNDEPREVGLTQDTWILLSALCAGKQGNDFVFTRENGKQVRDLRDAWAKLIKAGRMPELILHDFRRSALRNMIRRGVPERVAMAISGHKTRDVFDRYNIVSGADLRLAAQKIEEGIPVEKHKTSTMAVLPQPEEASVGARNVN